MTKELITYIGELIERKNLKTFKFLYECLKSDEKMTFFTGLTCPRFIWFFNKVKSIIEILYKKLSLDDHILLVLMKVKATKQWSNGLVVKAPGSRSRGPVSKPLCGSKVDTAFHPSEVDQMSTRNFWELKC